MKKKLSGRQLEQIFLLIRPFWPSIFGISAIIVVMALINQASPLINKALIDLLTGLNPHFLIWSGVNFWTLLFLLLVFRASGTLLDRFSTYVSRIIGAKMRFHLRKVAFDHLLSLSVGYYNRNQSGKVMSRVARGSDSVRSIVSNVGVHFIPSVVTAVISIFVVLSVNWVIGIATITMFVPFYFLRRLRFKAVEKLEKKQNQVWDRDYSHFWEVLANIRLVKIFSSQDLERNKFTRTSKKLIDGVTKIEKINNKTAVADILIDVWTMALYAYAFYQGLIGVISVGTVVLLVQYIEMIKQPLWNLNWILWEVKNDQIGIYDYLKILNTKPKLVDDPKPVQLTRVEGKVEFRDVHFHYPEKGGQHVFSGVSFVVKPGETLALVGRSGVGKTTVAHLLVRFFDPDKGEILLDGVDLKKLDSHLLHKHVGLVMQESYLYDDTIASNLRYGKPTASKKELIAACKIANAWEFVEKLPKKLDSVIGERGVRLSGGQRQRLSIARTVLQDPQVLILDEATSALDSHSEQLVQQALWRLSKGRTTVIIAHRLSTIKRADQIVVLSKGKIAEQGTHKQLLKKGGLYASLQKLQNMDADQFKEWDLVG